MIEKLKDKVKISVDRLNVFHMRYLSCYLDNNLKFLKAIQTGFVSAAATTSVLYCIFVLLR